ncbi:VOC family protein [Sphingomonas sp.]|uniref:VOC family protein n=1 Tax=Sphingomonas sp. TaxID=28214 RepID=UPI001EBBC25C|nr:VOC family protein [Sphingomonas sp.]MBX3595429.1 VOC family protein [Sphingomonas sp.]
MSTTFIEHVNLTVSNPARSARLMRHLFGWDVRWEGAAMNGGRTIHVGDDRFYLALYAPPAGDATRHPKGTPLNHVGIVVEDLDAIEAKVEAIGLVPFSHGDYPPGRRFYFLDHDGIEFEIVSYG